jgi:hypothetical protein
MSKQNDFEKAASERGERGFFSELCGFLRENKKWWLMPILIVLLLLGLLTILASTGLAPFIYTLF